MQIVVNFDDINWVDEEGYGIVDPSEVDDLIKSEIIGGLQDRLVKNLEKRMAEKLSKVEDDLVKQLGDQIDKIIEKFLETVQCDTIASLKIPYKEGSWNSEVKYLSITEYIGKKYEAYLTEKRFDENGNMPRYSGDGEYSLTDVLFKKVFGKELDEKVSKTIQIARETAEREIIGSLENTLQEQLTADIIKKINVPQMLKRLEGQYGEMALGDSEKKN